MISGQLLCYRVFDVGPDIKLTQVEAIVSQGLATPGTKSSPQSRSITIRESPLGFSAGHVAINGQNFDIHLKLWPFGAVSVLFSTKVEARTWEEFVSLSHRWESDSALTQRALELVDRVVQLLGPKHRLEKSIIEDYMIFFFPSLPGCEQRARDIFQHYRLGNLLLSEVGGVLNEGLEKTLQQNAIQYFEHDITVITWNSALVLDPSGRMDIPEVIEMALCQVLEMRYYDAHLEKKLDELYQALQAKDSIWSDQTEKRAREAARYYLEVQELVERVGNSLKVIGDLHLAQVFVMASHRFRFPEWREQVTQKLRTLNDISSLLMNNLHARRSQLLELIIIILIAVELIPFIRDWFLR
jgi:hypothetical protein